MHLTGGASHQSPPLRDLFPLKKNGAIRKHEKYHMSGTKNIDLRFSVGVFSYHKDDRNWIDRVHVLKYLESFCLLRLRRYWVVSRSLFTGTNRSNMGHTSQRKQVAFPDVTAAVMVMTMLVTMILIRLCASSLLKKSIFSGETSNNNIYITTVDLFHQKFLHHSNIKHQLLVACILFASFAPCSATCNLS